MKPFFTLRLLLSAVCFVFCSFSLFAQRIDGPAVICPGQGQVRYTFIPNGCNVLWGNIQGGPAPTIVSKNGNTMDVIFPAVTTEAIYILNAGNSCAPGGNTTLSVKVKAAPQTATKTLDVPCDYRNGYPVQADISYEDAQATWSTTTGWPVLRSPHTFPSSDGHTYYSEITYTVNNSNTGTVRAEVKYNVNECPSTPDFIYVYNITRSTSNSLPAPAEPSGPAFLCTNTNGTFSVPAYLNATSYTWTSNVTGVKINGQTPPVTITAANNGRSVTVSSATATRANISVSVLSSCGQSLAATRQVNVGVLSAAPRVYINGEAYTPGQILNLQRFSDNLIRIDPIPDATSYTWILSSNLLLQSGQGTNQIEVIVNGSSGQFISLSVQGSNSCAFGDPLEFSGQITADGLLANTFDIYPNPANNNITIKTNDRSGIATAKQARNKAIVNKHDIRQVKIYDNAGKLVNAQAYTKGIQQVNIPVNQLMPGIYYVEITSDITERKKIIIQR